MGAGLSSEQRMRTAAVIFPSFNFEEIAVALALSSMFFMFPEDLQSCECWSKTRAPLSGHVLKESSVRFFMVEVRLCRLPPLIGCSKTIARMIEALASGEVLMDPPVFY